jgi:hypothetical protein
MSTLPDRASGPGPGAPPLAVPDESSLPPLDRPAWPLQKIREILASGTPACVFWALRRVATNADPVEAADLEEAVDCLLDDPDLVYLCLDLFRDLAGHPAARDVAAAIAARPSPLDDDEGLERRFSLQVLASLAPADHVSSFAAGLESGSEKVEIAALDGIAASRSEGAAAMILGHLARTESACCALAALVGLCRLRAAGPVEEGIRLFIERFAGDIRNDEEGFGGLLYEVDDIIDLPLHLLDRAENSLYPQETSTAGDRMSIFLPGDDAGAAARAGLVGRERIERFLALADGGSYAELARLLGESALEVIERACADNPAFGPLGSTLAAVTRGILDRTPIGELEPDDQKLCAALLGTFLAHAIRGHDTERELEAAADRATLLDLLRVDEDWTDGRTIELAARVLREEDVDRLGGADRDVALTSWLLLAALRPRERGVAALTEVQRSSRNWHFTLPGLLRVAGDSLLHPLLELAREKPVSWTGVLAMALKLLGTERAGVLLEHSLDEILRSGGLGACDLLEIASATGSRAAAERVLDLIEEGAFDLEKASLGDPDLVDLTREIDACLGLFEIDGDTDEILAKGRDASGASHIHGAHCEGHEHDDEEYDDEEDDGFHDDDPDAIEPVAPIVRDAPKIGRNAPCPCGSGKKYKKCCGKGP